ncbi:VOC family protein [Flindersiella endophytica]
MTPDPFDGLYLPIVPMRPREEFVTALRRRAHAELGLALEGDAMSTTTAPVRHVDFALHYRDATAAVRWLVDVLGLAEEWRYPESGPVQHASLRWGSGSVSVNYKHGIYESLGPTYVLLAVPSGDELTAVYDRAVAAGAAVVEPVGDSWDGGSRQFVVRDPEGNLWQLSAPRG